MTNPITIPAAPVKINGYPIIKSEYIAGGNGYREGHMIIADRGPDSYHRYVTSWVGVGDNQWHQGDYTNDLKVAQSNFRIRADRYAGRNA